MHIVRLVVVGEWEGGGGQVVASSQDVDCAAVHRHARATVQVTQIAGRPPFRCVLPISQRVGRCHVRRDVVGHLDLGVVLHRVVLIAGAQDVPRRVGRVEPAHVARYRRAAAARHAGCERRRREGQRLPPTVGTVDVDPPRPRPPVVLAAAATERRAGLPAVEGLVRVVQVVGLRRVAGLDVRFEPGRHARDEVDDRTGRVARIGGRERSIHHVDALDFLRRDEPPARRVVGAVCDAVAQVVRQQNAVGIHGGSRAVAGARGTCRQDGVVVIADVALAHQQTGQVLQCIFAVGRVDAGFDLFARHALDGGRDLCGQRGRTPAGHGDDAERLHALMGFVCERCPCRCRGRGSRRLRQRRCVLRQGRHCQPRKRCAERERKKGLVQVKFSAPPRGGAPLQGRWRRGTLPGHGALRQLEQDQEKVGGARAGGGAAVAAAMRAAGIDWSARPSGNGGAMVEATGKGGGAPASMHSGQSMGMLPRSCAPSSVCTTTLTAPAAEHTSSIACGLTMGDAIATPSDSANQASTNRARNCTWKRG